MIDMTFANIANRNWLQKRREIKRKKTLSTIGVITVCTLFGAVLLGNKPSDYTYAIASENNPGLHYEYVTDRVCTVTEISEGIITVETRNGNLYEFYGDGYKVNDTVVCTFNSANELIAAK